MEKLSLGVTYGVPVEKGSVTTSHLANSLPKSAPADKGPPAPADKPATVPENKPE